MISPAPERIALNQFEILAKQYAVARGIVARRVENHEAEIRAVQSRLLPGIKSAAAEAADLQAQLAAAIQARPELFVKPRTIVFHGIKFGFQKGKGGLSAVNVEDSVAKIEKHFGVDAATYLIVKKTPRVAALLALDAATLKKLGFTIDDTGDSVFVKAADTEVDKLVARILKEGAVEQNVPHEPRAE